jgi:2-C-methyl-D-erythritol 4-phosphate cytidylyltransferase
MGSSLPKQFIPVNGRPILSHTIALFRKAIPGIRLIVVLPESYITYWENLCSDQQLDSGDCLCAGGEERFHSIKKALAHCADTDLIAVHDAVRPLVSLQTIHTAFSVAAEQGAAIPVVALSESVRKMNPDGSSTPEDRSQFRMVQTPQVFRAAILHQAYLQPYKATFTDDASVVESAGFAVALTEGNPENIKITTPHHLIVAEALLG